MKKMMVTEFAHTVREVVDSSNPSSPEQMGVPGYVNLDFSKYRSYSIPMFYRYVESSVRMNANSTQDTDMR